MTIFSKRGKIDPSDELFSLRQSQVLTKVLSAEVLPQLIRCNDTVRSTGIGLTGVEQNVLSKSFLTTVAACIKACKMKKMRKGNEMVQYHGRDTHNNHCLSVVSSFWDASYGR